MFKTCEEAIAYIESKRIKRTFLDFQKIVKKYIAVSLPYTIHIAGTNGKGSTVLYLKEILCHHGYQVGTFTSPYMITHNDRICIDGIPISDTDLLFYINKYYSIIEKEGLSMFEIDTMIMLDYFSNQELDFCIIETGIGGKEDKTNVISSDISAITNIGYDHQNMLGETLPEIALHKAGIIKDNQIFITSETNTEIVDLFKSICLQKNTTMEIVAEETGNVFGYQNHTYTLSNVGSYQIHNAKLAVAIAHHCITLQPLKVQVALAHFSYPGRFEKIGKVYLDGAHNVDGIQALLKSIEQYDIKNVAIIFSALSDKDSKHMMRLLQRFPLYLASFPDERIQSLEPNYQEVYQSIKRQYDSIIFTGSLHFISIVRKYIKAITA
jgi:dihydrofolate synthase/folylpolyglutamate synthase